MFFPVVTAKCTLIKGLTFVDDVMPMVFTLLTLATQIFHATKDIRATQLA
jgi:hypothetical protein